jgi:hypothetical protein
MSDVFKNIDYGGQAQNLLQRVQSQETKIAAEKAKRTQKGTIEENVGLLKASLGGQKLTEGLLKGAKPYLKQQTRKALNSVKDNVQKFSDRLTGTNRELVDATKARDDLQTTNETNEGVRMAKEADAQNKVDNASEDGLDAAKAEQTTLQTANDADRAAEAGAMSDANAAVSAAEDTSTVASSIASKVAAKTAEKVTSSIGKKVGEDAVVEGVEVGAEITGTEAIGAALDATGIGAPLGILIGALGIGLGARQESDKRQPKMAPQPLNQSGATFQAGISQ